MELARATHFGPGPRLSGLAALLRTASGSPVPVVTDLADGLALPAGTIACLVLDLAAVPPDDLGLLRRLRARQPGLAVLWTGPAALAAALSALAEAGDEFRPWPLDVTLLPGFRTAQACPGDAGVGAGVASAVERAPSPLGRAPEASLRAAPAFGTRERAARGTIAGVDSPASLLDPDLRHIEAILAGFGRGATTPAPVDTGVAPHAARQATADGLGRATALAARPLDAELAAFPLEGEDEDDLALELEAETAECAAPFVSDGPLLTHEELEAFLAPDPAALDALPANGTEAGPADAGRWARGGPSQAVRGLPHWYRDQVADLADLVQRAELALHAADETQEGPSAPDGERSTVIDAARLELARLRQFARTLGCLAAPPAAGATRLDLGVLVEETLASLAQRPPSAGNAEFTGDASAAGERAEGRPRFLFRSQAGVDVQADKGLLVAALDAVLGVATAAAGAADVVRTEVLATDAGVAEVRVDLPEGRLTGLEPARVLEPYALRKRLPGIGPHALAAAGGILVGHGGDLIVERRTPGPNERARLVFVLRLPASPLFPARPLTGPR